MLGTLHFYSCYVIIIRVLTNYRKDIKMDNVDDLTLLHRFYQCSHRLHSGGKCRGQNRLLIQLLEKGPLTQRELSAVTGLRSATLSEQLDNMEKAGYITRTRNSLDRRHIDVALTPSGQDAADTAQKNRARRAERLFRVLSREEKAQLQQLLDRLLTSWEEPAEREEKI